MPGTSRDNVEAASGPSELVPRTEPFERHTDRYEAWFENFEHAYASEVDALESLRRESGRAMEIGVGTGRFAEPLDVSYGIDPARDMLGPAADRGIHVVQGVAEAVPFADDTFDLVLVVTTICFVDSVDTMFAEAGRLLRPGGSILLGYIDKESRVGKHYQEIKDENPFYRPATFHSTEGVLNALDAAGFDDVEIRQTIFQMPDEMTEPDTVREGHGDGSFVALRAIWPGNF